MPINKLYYIHMRTTVCQFCEVEKLFFSMCQNKELHGWGFAVSCTSETIKRDLVSPVGGIE